MSRSLRNALRKGLVVRYSVNEQVAGHFEVLIARSLARRLKLGGAPATGLPAGTPPQLVIAKAILVTTKGGHSTIHIKFSKHVAERLKHTHKVAADAAAGRAQRRLAGARPPRRSSAPSPWPARSPHLLGGRTRTVQSRELPSRLRRARSLNTKCHRPASSR